MSYKISEEQFDELMMKQFDKLFYEDVNFTRPYDYDDDTGEEFEDPNRLEFYFGNYGDEDTFFRWYDKDYWGGTESNSYMNYKQNSPLIEVEEPHLSTLNNLFGDKWYKPFKKWVQIHFDIPVKTIIDELYNKRK